MIERGTVPVGRLAVGRLFQRSIAWCQDRLARIRRLSGDQSGTISIVSVFGMMVLAMLLGMVMNAARQVDGKVKMQNAADAAAYSGGVVLARGMNTLAFTNHLLSDVFALTAFMREARDRQSQQMVPDVLQAWSRIGPQFASSGFPKFDRLGQAITQKVPMEQEMVDTYSDWASASSEMVLPVLEQILSEELIPEFQRDLVQATPYLVQQAAAEVAQRHGQSSADRGPLQIVLWRTNAQMIGSAAENQRTTLPVIDPVQPQMPAPGGGDYIAVARRQRRRLAEIYLEDWNRESLHVFDEEAKMSQFSQMWRGFTCGQLDKLLEDEYPESNLPHLIRTTVDDMRDTQQHLDQDFMFVSVAYWPQLKDILPGLFANPTKSDAEAFAQIMLFVPEPRLVYRGPQLPVDNGSLGGVPGELLKFPTDQPPPPQPNPGAENEVIRQSLPRNWDLLNQNWTVQLVPASTEGLAAILQSTPQGLQSPVRVPQLGNLESRELRDINTH